MYTLRVRFSYSPIFVSNYFLTLPNSVREEKFGNGFVRCRLLRMLTLIVIRVYAKLQVHADQTASLLSDEQTSRTLEHTHAQR